MDVRVNGEKRTVAEGITVQELITALGLTPERVAAEVNGAVVPRAERPARVLSAGDEVELVTFVGGG